MTDPLPILVVRLSHVPFELQRHGMGSNNGTHHGDNMKERNIVPQVSDKHPSVGANDLAVLFGHLQIVKHHIAQGSTPP